MTYTSKSNQSGDISELKVKTDLILKGWQVLVPHSRDSPYDLVVDRGDGIFETVQVKTMQGNSISKIIDRSGSRVAINGKVRNSIDYAKLGVDWLVGHRPTTGDLYFYKLENYSEIPTKSFSVKKWAPDEFPYWEPEIHH